MDVGGIHREVVEVDVQLRHNILGVPPLVVVAVSEVREYAVVLLRHGHGEKFRGGQRKQLSGAPAPAGGD